MSEIAKLYKQLQPYIAEDLRKSGRGAGSGGGSNSTGAIGVHDINVTHSGNLLWGRVDKTGSSIGDLTNHSHTALSGVTADQHHPRSHSMISADDHTYSGGAALDLFGLTAASTLGIISPSSNPGATSKILKSTAGGGLTLESETVNGALTVGQTILSAGSSFRAIHHTHDYDHVHVVVNPGETWNLDEQFGVDIDDNLLVRGWIVGKHAIQLSGALFIGHYDGPEKFNTIFKGNPTGHLGQVATTTGGVIFRAGKFLKAIQIAEGTTNIVPNPRFATNTTGWTEHELSHVRRSDVLAPYGENYLAVSGDSGDPYEIATINTGSALGGRTFTLSYFIRGGNASSAVFGGPSILAQNFTSLGTIAAEGVIPGEDWVRHTLTVTVPGGVTETSLQIILRGGGASNELHYCAVQLEEKAYATPYCDGSLGGYNASTGLQDGSGHAWSGTAHSSSSVRTVAALYYPMGNNVNANYGTILCWYKSESTGILRDIVSIDGTTAGAIVLRIGTSNEIIGQWGTATVSTSANAVLPNVWYNLAITFESGVVSIYKNGALVTSGASTGFSGLPVSLGVGLRLSSGTRHINGLLDDLVILDRAATVDELRAVYDSNAPVFAETSTWHWRTGRNRVWSDAEGLFVVNGLGQAAFAVYAGNDDGTGTKSWGGVSLSSSDILMGDDSRGGYVWWDDSAATLQVAGQIVVQSGSTGIANYTDAGPLVDAEDLDDVPNGTTYGRVVNTIIAAGLIQVGSGTKDSTLDGWNIGVSEIVGQLNGDDQIVLNTSGQIVAGGGNILIDAGGIDLQQDDYISNDSSRSLTWWQDIEDRSGDPTQSITATFDNLGYNHLIMAARGAGSSGHCFATLLAEPDTGTTINLRVQSEGYVTTNAPFAVTLSTNTWFLGFGGATGGGNPIQTGALGSYAGKARININGTDYWLPYYS